MQANTFLGFISLGLGTEIILSLFFIFPLLIGLFARRKGYSFLLWLFGSGIFGFFSHFVMSIILAFLPFANKPELAEEQKVRLRKRGNTIGGVAMGIGMVVLLLVFVLPVWQKRSTRFATSDARTLAATSRPSEYQASPVPLRTQPETTEVLLPSGARIAFSKPVLFQDRASFQSTLLQKLASRGWPTGPMYSVNCNLYQVMELARGYGSTERAFAQCFAGHAQSSRSVMLNNRTWIMTDIADGYIEPLTKRKVLTESAFCYLYSDDKKTVLVVGVLDLATKLGWKQPKALDDYSAEEKVKNLLESSECMNTTQQFAAGFESL